MRKLSEREEPVFRSTLAPILLHAGWDADDPWSVSFEVNMGQNGAAHADVALRVGPAIPIVVEIEHDDNALGRPGCGIAQAAQYCQLSGASVGLAVGRSKAYMIDGRSAVASAIPLSEIGEAVIAAAGGSDHVQRTASYARRWVQVLDDESEGVRGRFIGGGERGPCVEYFPVFHSLRAALRAEGIDWVPDRAPYQSTDWYNFQAAPLGYDYRRKGLLAAAVQMSGLRLWGTALGPPDFDLQPAKKRGALALQCEADACEWAERIVRAARRDLA